MKLTFLLSSALALAAFATSLAYAEKQAICKKFCGEEGALVCCPGEFGFTDDITSSYETPAQRCQTILNQPAVDLDSSLLDELKTCKNVAKQEKEAADAEAKALAELEAEKAKLRKEKAQAQAQQQPQPQPPAQPAPAQPAPNFVNFTNFGAQPGEMPLIQDPYSQSQ